MAVNGILLGQNTGNNSAPVFFNIDTISDSDLSSIKTQIDKLYGKCEIIAYSESAGYCYITKHTEDYTFFMRFNNEKIGYIKFDYTLPMITEDNIPILRKSRTISLSSTGWTENDNKYVQTVNVSGAYGGDLEPYTEIQITPAVKNMDAYVKFGVYASDCVSNKITFTAFKKPTENLTVYAIIQDIK